MTLKELNAVRNMKKRLSDEQKKLNALKIVVGALPHKYGKTDSVGSSGKNFNSMFEKFTDMIVDCEKQIEHIQAQMLIEISRLTKKIQENFTSPLIQSILLYRYVACKHFKEISFLLGYSEQWVYKTHKKIINEFSQV